MRQKQIIRVLSSIVCSAYLMSCSGSDSPKENLMEENKLFSSFLSNIKTVKVISGNQNEELVLTGKVEYDPDKVINYISLVNGIADRTYFSLGDKVQKGQVLLDTRSSDLSALQSEAISAQSDMKIAQRELKTAQSLYEDGMLSERELLETEAKVKQAQANYNKVQSDMGIHGISKRNGIFSIKSPMTGYIVDKNVSSGSTVSTDGESLFTVADLSTVWVIANVYASNLQFVKEGMEVDITTISYPGDVFRGKMGALSQIFDPEEKVLKARIVLENKDMKLKPEMSVTIKLKGTSFAQFVTIPSDALIFDNDRYFVIVKCGESFKSKEVRLQGHNGKITYIASGLSAGENVVVNNQLLIYSGLKEG